MDIQILLVLLLCVCGYVIYMENKKLKITNAVLNETEQERKDLMQRGMRFLENVFDSCCNSTEIDKTLDIAEKILGKEYLASLLSQFAQTSSNILALTYLRKHDDTYVRYVVFVNSSTPAEIRDSLKNDGIEQEFRQYADKIV